MILLENTNKLISVFYSDDLFFVVCAAVFADSVGHNERSALAALHQIHFRHLPVCVSLISSGFRSFIFRADRHGHTSLYLPDLSIFTSLKIDRFAVAPMYYTFRGEPLSSFLFRGQAPLVQ